MVKFPDHHLPSTEHVTVSETTGLCPAIRELAAIQSYSLSTKPIAQPAFTIELLFFPIHKLPNAYSLIPRTAALGKPVAATSQSDCTLCSSTPV
jgi:hypothetical protein